MNNTSKWIPYKSVAPIVLKNNDFPDHPFFSGTGFFVKFPPFPYIFFVTARHCVFDNKETCLGRLQIPWKNSVECKEPIIFEECINAKTETSGGFFEDIAVFVIGDMLECKIQHLDSRALNLECQETVMNTIHYIRNKRENVRIVGYPGVSKCIDYNKREMAVQARGCFGTITPQPFTTERFEVSNLNWKGSDFDGFSGSPVLSLCPNSSGGVTPVVLGVVSTGSSKKFSAVNINAITDLIACWIACKNKIDIGYPVEVA